MLCDERGRQTGTAEKLVSHHDKTPLHLAFSCYVFDENGKFLVTQRARRKKVWPGVWTNSVCGHPAPNESLESAMRRRLSEELGMTATEFKLVLPKYRYTTPPYKGIIENEFCPVFVARATSEPQPNPEEVESYRWLSWSVFVADAEADSNDYLKIALVDFVDGSSDLPTYSWWCKDQLKLIKNHELIKNYSQSIS